MSEKEMYDIYQMVNNIINLMDNAETPENGELFEKIRWAFGELELKLITVSNCLTDMREAFLKFSEAYFSATEELSYKYNKPNDA